MDVILYDFISDIVDFNALLVNNILVYELQYFIFGLQQLFKYDL